MDQDMFELDEEAGLEFAPEGEPQVVADDHYEWATATLLDEFDLNAFSMEQFSEAIDHLVDSGEVSPEEAEEVMDRLRELVDLPSKLPWNSEGGMFGSDWTLFPIRPSPLRNRAKMAKWRTAQSATMNSFKL
ncbi:hypothetical protein PTTG_07385 [Puccinia triticina 1-1 BBBD Race 1]|uniref:Uncharacterized protein n=1 Tax=Puccinia triticina (isolate 1-1 / race 1 (BBBD)) TaxID=630390 RepID=A0A0C4F2R4_PUCT1|nr:hypothetical protein PTTG_07385 [Puccinia triticina 1-1 BBBD Race 1]